MGWFKVGNDTKLPHSNQDCASDYVLVWVKKAYGPSVYIGYYDYEGDYWSVLGLEYSLFREKWEVTHWQPLPEDPE